MAEDFNKLTQEQPPDPSAPDYPLRLNFYLERQLRLLRRQVGELTEDVGDLEAGGGGGGVGGGGGTTIDPATTDPLLVNFTPGTVGVSLKYAREDHRHKLDSTINAIGVDTWTGAHTWTPSGNFTPITINAPTSADMQVWQPLTGANTVVTKAGDVGVAEPVPTAQVSIRAHASPSSTITAISPAPSLWIDAPTSLAGLGDGAEVVTWPDISGNARHFAQDEAGGPAISTTTFAIGGKRAVVSPTAPSPNVGKFMHQSSGSAYSVSGAFTFALVWRACTPSNTEQSYVFGRKRTAAGTEEGLRLPNPPASIPIGIFYSASFLNISSNFTPVAGSIHALVITRTAGGVHAAYLDGVDVTSGTPTNTATLMIDSLLCADEDTPGNFYSNPNSISEFIVFPGTLGGTDISTIFNYFTTKYGTTGGTVSAGASTLQDWKAFSGTVDSIVDSNIRFGLGTLTPASKLHVVGAFTLSTTAGGFYSQLGLGAQAANIIYTLPPATVASSLLSNDGAAPSVLTWKTPATLGLVSGTGTAPRIPVWASASTLGNSDFIHTSGGGFTNELGSNQAGGVNRKYYFPEIASDAYLVGSWTSATENYFPRYTAVGGGTAQGIANSSFYENSGVFTGVPQVATGVYLLHSSGTNIRLGADGAYELKITRPNGAGVTVAATYDALGSGAFHSFLQQIRVGSTATHQLQLSYDVGNFMTALVSSAGAVTFDATGASAGFTFSDPVTLSSTLAAIGVATFTAQDVHLNGISNLSTSAVTQFTTGYDATHNLTWATSSVGANTLTVAIPIADVTSSVTKGFVIKPSVSWTTKTGVSIFEVQDHVPSPRFQVIKTSPASTGYAIRMGFDASNYLQLLTSSVGLTTITAVGTSPSLTLSPTVTFGAVATFNAVPVFAVGATVTAGQTLFANIHDSNAAAGSTGITIGPSVARTGTAKAVVFADGGVTRSWINTAGNLVFASGKGIFAYAGLDETTYPDYANILGQQFTGSLSSDKEGLHLIGIASPSNASTITVFGARVEAGFTSLADSSTVVAAVGGSFVSSYRGAFNSTSAVAVIGGQFIAQAQQTGTGAAISAYLAGGQFVLSATGTNIAIANVYGILFDAYPALGAGTTVTNHYGMFLPQSIWGGTLNTGLWLDGTTAGYKALILGSTSNWIGPESSTTFSLNATSILCKADFKISTLGKGLYIKEGANATMGIATLVAGAVTVATNKVTANSRIFLTVNGVGVLANLGSPYENTATRVAATSFDIKSTNVLDTSNVAWAILEPA